ncbi:hypothetical protein [Spirochaeta africana]|uniref:hypothetical protein n=1 Tax=Spirochaeta africana TaxID=46355 RepID=UPI0012E9FD18|nr:hypothetical protein [Spirochaeta africana]
MPQLRSRKTLIFLFLLLGAGQAMVYAAGAREDPVRQAAVHIEEQRYNEALQLLAQAVQDDPDRIWEAARLIQGISQARSEYNDQWRQLIQSLRDEPDNSAQALEIIQRMEQIDRFPNPRTTQQVRDARRTVRFRFNQTEFQEIMQDGAELLAGGEYIAAIDRYASGFPLFREEFLEEQYGNIFENRVLGLSSRLDSATSAMRSAVGGLEAELPVGTDQIADTVRLQQQIDQVMPLLDELQEIRNEVVTVAGELDEQNDLVPQLNEELDQDWYLVFLNRFALGRRDAEAPEGVAGAAAQATVDLVGGMVDQALEVAEGIRTQALAAFDSEAWDTAIDRWNTLSSYGQLIETLDDRFFELHQATGELPDTSRILAQRQPLRARLARLQQQGDDMAGLSAALTDFSQLAQIPAEPLPVNLADNAGQLEAVRTLLRGIDTGPETVTDDSDPAVLPAVDPDAVSVDTAETDTTASDPHTVRVLAYQQDLELRLQDWDERLRMAQIELYRTAAAIRELPFRTAISGWEDDLQLSEQELTGIDEVTVEEGAEITVTRRYPQDALPRLQQVRDSSQATALQLQQYQAFLAAIPADVAADTRLEQYIAEAAQLAEQLAALQARTAALLADAEEAIALADQADTQGRQLLAAARAQLAQRNVDQARSLLDQADSQFFDALDYRYDQDVREEYQQLTSVLGEQIIETQTVIVIEQVRERITRGRSLFQQDDFFAAEQVLQEAQDLWETVNPGEPNPEIRNWLGLVRAALNLQTNREITEESPLYFTLVPFLNRAKDQFQQGIAALDRGNRDQAEQLLARSDDNLNAVISAQPFNQEARVLQLRIQQRLDPAEFQQTFEARVQDALQRRATEPENALADLQDLATLQPDYPGIDQAIFQLEITLGIRQAPIDRTAEIQSNNLVQRARQVAAGGTREQLQAAVGLLEEAIEINPENQEAVALLDQYRISIGGQVTTSISFEAQQRFRQAENLFVQGDIAASYAIVQQLLQSPQNQRYTPLINLQRRLETRLGI